MTPPCRSLFLCACALLAPSSALHAQPAADTAPSPTSAVAFDQRFGERLPLDLAFVDPEGRPRALREFFGQRPVLLSFGYADCPQLCSLVADSTATALRRIRPEVGRDLDVVSISIDPAETPEKNTRRRDEAVHRYGRAGDPRGWFFLTGDADAIRAVTAAAGYRYRYDPPSRQYAHPSGFVILTPEGVVSRYFLGLDFEPAELARALRRAEAGGVGAPVSEIILQCFRGDGLVGRHGPLIWRSLLVGVSLTVAALFGGVGRMLWLERRATIRSAAKEARP